MFNNKEPVRYERKRQHWTGLAKSIFRVHTSMYSCHFFIIQLVASDSSPPPSCSSSQLIHQKQHVVSAAWDYSSHRLLSIAEVSGILSAAKESRTSNLAEVIVTLKLNREYVLNDRMVVRVELASMSSVITKVKNERRLFGVGMENISLYSQALFWLSSAL